MATAVEQETKKVPHAARIESADGIRISAGPYIGIVKNVIDPLYSGVLQVYIPELGGDPSDNASWKNMMYATPFYGRTNIQDDSGSYQGSPHSYGMWFVPPDIDNKVLCIFANGDPAKGYWFACIPDFPATHMVPGISAPVDGTQPFPVVDYGDNKDNNPSAAISNAKNVRGLQKSPHGEQQKIWDRQNLTNDPDRGPGRSSSQRETPSAVFGISTPGRTIDKDDPSFYPDNAYTIGGQKQTTASGKILGVRGRKGGHTFVMDDGDSDGNNQMFRLRSAAGHMILMNDTKEFIYIINSQGTSWIEMNKEGAINIFSGSTMNVTAKTGLNFETDGALKIHGKTIDIVADDGFSLKAKDINILADGAAKLTAKSELHLLSKKNAYLTGDACIQIKSNGHIDADSACHTINTAGATPAKEASEAKKPEKMPASEPWSGHHNANDPTAGKSFGSKEGLATGIKTQRGDDYGATGNYGSGGAQQNYGPITNNTPPVTYGPQTNYSGAGYYTTNQQSGGIDWQTVGTIGGAIAGIALTSSGGYSPSDTNPNMQPEYSVGELQNNPGNLPYNNADKFVVGYNNNLAVYAKPEEGIAALAVAFDNLNTSIATRSIDLIVGFLNAKSNNDPKVLDFTRYMQNNTGIVADDHVALNDPATRISWVAYVIKYLQGRIIYTYDQIVTGCAYSVGVDYTTFLSGIQPVTKPWQNNNGANPFSGFVNPAKDSGVVNNGSSPLKTIGSALLGGFLGGQLGKLFDGSNQQTSQDTPQPQVIAVNDINAARRYLESNPDTASGTVFQYPNGDNFRLGGGGSTRLNDYPGIFENGTVFGNQQCAAIPQSTISGFGTMASLQRGDAVLGNFNIPPGTVITTFNFRDANGNPAYAPPGSGGISGQSHTAVYLGQGSDTQGQYIVVQDQWAGSGGCGVRKIYTGGAEGADQMYIAKSAANGYDAGGVRVPGSENYAFTPRPEVVPVPEPRPPAQDLDANQTVDKGRDFKAPSYNNPNDAYGGSTNAASAANFDAASAASNLAQTTQSSLADKLPGDVSGSAAALQQYEIYRDSVSLSLDPQEPIPPSYNFEPIVAVRPEFVNNVTFTSVNDRDAEFERDYNLSQTNLGLAAPQEPDNNLIVNKNLGLGAPELPPDTLAVNNSLGVARPDAADAPLAVNNRLVYDQRTGEVVQIGSGKTAVDAKTPITGQNPATGTGGTTGAQRTPQGASQAGSGGKSC